MDILFRDLGMQAIVYSAQSDMIVAMQFGGIAKW
jgi:hypothetical protein